MKLNDIKLRLEVLSILFSEHSIGGRPSVIGYDKKFKWRWFATQLNTFLVAIDFGNEPVNVPAIDAALAESFSYAQKHYNGWPRGLQSGLGVITFLLSSHLDAAAIDYCENLKAGKKWAGFAVPVVIHSDSGQVHAFQRNPLWGRIYYPYFKQLIHKTTA